MDPDASWSGLLAALESGDRDRVLETAAALTGWIERGGFPPNTTGVVTDPEWNRRIARHACQVAIDMASRQA